MRKCVYMGVVLSLTMLFLGCGDTGPKTSPREEVAGTVTLDGQPMNEKDAEISFSAPGEAPVVLPIKDGKFAGKAPKGESRVEISAYRPGEPIMMDGKPFGDPQKVNYVAEEFNLSSTLKANIAAGGAKDLKFEVTSKK